MTNMLRTRLNAFLAGGIADKEFSLYLALILRDSGDEELLSLAHSIQLSFAMAAAGDLTSKELLEELYALANPTPQSTGTICANYQEIIITEPR